MAKLGERDAAVASDDEVRVHVRPPGGLREVPGAAVDLLERRGQRWSRLPRVVEKPDERGTRASRDGPDRRASPLSTLDHEPSIGALSRSETKDKMTDQYGDLVVLGPRRWEWLRVGGAPEEGGRPSPLTTIKRIQRSEEIRRQIEDAIRSGDFGPGERLPSERELVETFGVSRVSVREAIRSLEALGFVKVYQGRGVFVADRRSGLGEPIARWLDLHRDEVLELLGVRGALDEYAAQLAVENYEPGKIAEIAAANEVFTTAVESSAPTEELVPLDIDFHIAIAEASGNRLLYDLLSDLHSYLAESRYLAFTPVGRPALSASEHALIVEAIKARDAALAPARHEPPHRGRARDRGRRDGPRPEEAQRRVGMSTGKRTCR